MTFATSPEALVRHSMAVLDHVREHLAGRHNDPDAYQPECLACDHYRLDVELERAQGALVRLAEACAVADQAEDNYLTTEQIREAVNTRG